MAVYVRCTTLRSAGRCYTSLIPSIPPALQTVIKQPNNTAYIIPSVCELYVLHTSGFHAFICKAYKISV